MFANSVSCTRICSIASRYNRSRDSRQEIILREDIVEKNTYRAKLICLRLRFEQCIIYPCTKTCYVFVLYETCWSIVSSIMRHCRDCIDLCYRVIEKYRKCIDIRFYTKYIRYVYFQIGLKFYRYNHDDRIFLRYQRNFKMSYITHTICT